MKKLVIFIVLAVGATAYRNGKRASAVSSFDDFPPYQETRQHPPYYEQHQPFREQSFKPSQQSFQSRPYRQDVSYQDTSFGDQSTLRDYTPFKHRPYYGEGSNFREGSSFKRGTPFFTEGSSFGRDQSHQFRDQQQFRSEQNFRDQTPYPEQFSYQQQSYREEFQPFTESFKESDSYKEHKQSDQEPGFFSRPSEYLKYGNHGLGYASVPTISSYENALPLNDETSTTVAPSTAPTATHRPLLQSTVSTATSAITKVHTAATSSSKMASAKSPTSTITGTVKSDTLGDMPATTASSQTVSKTPAEPVTAKSSNLVHQSTLTTGASLPVMVTESSLMSFDGKTLSPIQFQTTKLSGTPSTFYIPGDLKSKIQQSVVNYLLGGDTKTSLKDNDNSFLDYVLPEESGNGLNSKLQGSVLGYMLPEESKNLLKDSVQRSLLKYAMLKRGLSFQQPALSDTLSYLPLANLDRQKMTLPSLPMSSLSTLSRPMESVNYLQTLPRMSFMHQPSQGIQLDTALSTGLSSGIQENQPASIFNSLPTGITGGISSGISGNMSPSIPNGIPTLNFGQNFQHVGQMRQFEPPRSQHFPAAGLQLQLGGFGGIDYIQPNNPSQRPMELGIAKVGLSLPELQRPHVPTFAKLGFGQQLW